MKVVFWNIAKNDLTAELMALVDVVNPDILFLAESQMAISNVLLALNNSSADYFYNVDPICKKIRMFSKFREKYVAPITSSLRYTVRHIAVPSYVDYNIMCVHFQSKINWDFADQAAHASELSLVINEFEEKANSLRTLIIGDFNMNPFDFGMVQTTGLHSVMSKEIALRKSRKVDGKDYRFFYNPMWSFYGDQGKGKVNGTTYNSLSKPINYFWNIFDQVLVRPELIEYMDESKLEIITELGNSVSLLKPSGVIDESISDHLPILITVKNNSSV